MAQIFHPLFNSFVRASVFGGVLIVAGLIWGSGIPALITPSMSPEASAVPAATDGDVFTRSWMGTALSRQRSGAGFGIAGSAEEIEEAIFVEREHAQAIELALELEGLRPVPQGLREERLDMPPVPFG